jgi:hypothetical protein
MELKIISSCKDTKKAIFHFNFATQKEMNLSFIRFSEYIESPKYKGTLFPRQSILDYIPNYDKIVLGHNIPSNKFKEFKVLFKTNFSLFEQIVIEKIDKYNAFDDFYVIATYNAPTKFTAIDHETAHALYYLIPKYKQEVLAILNKYKLDINDTTSYFSSMYDILEFYEYDKSVWTDEIHAHLVDLGLGFTGFFYGRDLEGFFIQLKKGKVRLHFKYKKIGKDLVRVYNTFKKDLTVIS